MKQNLTIEPLIDEAKKFCERKSTFDNPELYGKYTQILKLPSYRFSKGGSLKIIKVI